MGAAFSIGVTRLEPWAGRLRASALPTESAPTNIARYIDGQRCAMKQPVIELMAFSSNLEFSLPQENALFGSSARILAKAESILTEHPLVSIATE